MPDARLWWIDAFAERIGAGNPAAVCLLEAALADDELQLLAAEFAQPATAFLHRRPDADFDLRWFTARSELALCGHATLASVVALSEVEPDRASFTFHTRSGPLLGRRAGDEVLLDVPTLFVEPTEPEAGLLEALGVASRFVGRTRFDRLVLVDDEATVRGLQPDFARLAAIDFRGVIVTAPGSGDADFVSRFFAPRVGLNEDAVTGSAHAALGPFWAARLGRRTLLARQLSRRGGRLGVSVQDDRVTLSGSGLVVARGRLA